MLLLREYGLVKHYDKNRALYQLSERGRKWLKGEFDAKELEVDS